MEIVFNKLNRRYNNYNIKTDVSVAKQEKAKEVEKATQEFIGLDNETDLLTKNTQYLYGVQLGKFTTEDKDLAEQTNAILASLGYKDYKVSAAQVASVTAGVNTVVMPGMKMAEDGAVAANIQDPSGPFAELFT